MPISPKTLVLPVALAAAGLLLLLTSATRSQTTVPAAGPGGEAGTPVPPEQVVADLGWLAGTWSGPMWGGRFVAYYSTPEGGRVLSYSRLLRDGEEAFYEFEVFEAREHVVHLVPFPRGTRADGFRLSRHEPKARKAVFENPENDFPTRIVYERIADDNLVITLDDPHGDGDRVQRFDLKKDG